MLGAAGASLAIGVPFVSAGSPPERRGLALGVYGADNLGTAVADFSQPARLAPATVAYQYLFVGSTGGEGARREI